MHSDLDDYDAGSHSSEHCMAAPAGMTLEVGSAEGLAPMQKRLLRIWLVEPSTSGPSQRNHTWLKIIRVHASVARPSEGLGGERKTTYEALSSHLSKYLIRSLRHEEKP